MAGISNPGPFQLISDQEVSAVATITFSGLSGDLFQLYYALNTDAARSLHMTLNGVTLANYNYRRFKDDDEVDQTVGDTKFYMMYIGGPECKAIGCVLICGKKVGANNILTIAQYASPFGTAYPHIVDGLVTVASDLSSIELYPDAGNISGRVKLLKVI